MIACPGAPIGRTRRLAAETAALLQGIVYQDDTTAAGNLRLFDRFDRWTAPLFANYWEFTTETARKRLRHLVDAGVVVCVAGAVSGHGGREPDLYTLAPHGALVLDHLHGRPRHTTKAPQLAAGEPTVTARGRHKLPHVAGGTTPHVLNCLRLALHQGWVRDGRWRIMRRTAGRGGAGDEPIPDFALTVKDQLFAVEVEGTLHRAHINEKHRRFASLARRLGANLHVYLSIILTFPDDRDYANARHAHELAFARQGRDYYCYIARLPAVLAAKPGTPLWDLEEQLDWREIRERERAHHERMGCLYDGW
jgi:hypothetical protein